MKPRILLLVVAAALWIQSCGGGSKHNDVQPAPAQATLESPAQNAVCISGAIVSSTQSAVTFSWAAAANASSYDLVLKNLLTATSTTQSTNSTTLTININQNTPYSWYIVSKSAGGIVASDTWKFYNSGPGMIIYPPYPAEITTPTFGQSVTASSGTVNLAWTGSSVTPGTIVNYDVYFGSSTTPLLLQSEVTTSYLNGVAVTSGTTYYWKVITRDSAGNTSDSGVYWFSVK
ncbi:MAG TPA: hypothetical protein VG367_05240 [Mucilaginibacter sp.]|jgi:hypothetical protein|nr:hypothetical protein [Mucilaginibacter sp.]